MAENKKRFTSYRFTRDGELEARKKSATSLISDAPETPEEPLVPEPEAVETPPAAPLPEPALQAEPIAAEPAFPAEPEPVYWETTYPDQAPEPEASADPLADSLAAFPEAGFAPEPEADGEETVESALDEIDPIPLASEREIYDPEEAFLGSYTDAERAIFAGNPFLYTGTNPKVKSIEQFESIDASLTLGEAFRGDLPLSEKSRIINQTFKKWRKDFQIHKQEILVESDAKINIIDLLIIPKIKRRHKFIVPVVGILLLFLMYLPGTLGARLAQNDFFATWQEHLQAWSNSLWGKISLYSYLCLLIVCVGYFFLHNLIIGNFDRLTKKSRSVYATSSRLLERDFKYRYRMLRRYYLKNLKDPRATKVYILHSGAKKHKTIDEIARLANSAFMKTSYMKSQSKKLRLGKILALIGAYLMLGYLLIILILKMFI